MGIFRTKEKKDSQSVNRDIQTIMRINKELQNKIELLERDANFVGGIIHQSGDLIHYQEHDYKDEFPIAGMVFSVIGNLLRYFAAEPIRHKMKVSQLLEVSSSISNSSDREMVPGLLKEINNFTAIHLIDMVSRMQGQRDTNDWKLAAETVKHVSNLKSK